MDELSRAGAAPWAARDSMFSQPGPARPVPSTTPHDLGRLRASHARRPRGKPLAPPGVASPRLGDELFARLLAYGTPQETHPGDVGDVHSGSMKRVAAATGEGASAIASVHKAISPLL